MKHSLIVTFLVIGITACASEPQRPIEGISSHISQVQRLSLVEGKMAFEDSKTPGPIVILVPGMGETRGSYRLLAPKLSAAGFRVIAVDPRGQGDSDASFSSFAASAVGDDLVQLVDHLGTDVYLVGNSSGGASAAWVAANRPERVKGVIFLDAFLRDHPIGFMNRVLLNVGLVGPWAASAWIGFYKGLFVTNPPLDQDQYTQSLKQSLDQEGHLHALRKMIFTSKSDIEARLSEVHAPVLAIAGSKDTDFENGVEDELNWIITKTGGQKQLVAGAGHYPHLEFPDEVTKAIAAFIRRH